MAADLGAALVCVCVCYHTGTALLLCVCVFSAKGGAVGGAQWARSRHSGAKFRRASQAGGLAIPPHGGRAREERGGTQTHSTGATLALHWHYAGTALGTALVLCWCAAGTP